MRSRVERFDLVSLAAAGSHPDLEPLVGPNGAVGLLAGLTYSRDGVTYGSSLPIAARPPDNVTLIHLMLLTADEYAYAMQVQDSSNLEAIALRIQATGRLISDPSRVSVLHDPLG